MRHHFVPLSALIGLTLLTGGPGITGAQETAKTPSVARTDSRKVIVILRDQMAETAMARGSLQGRASTLASAQRPVIEQLQKLRSRDVRSFATINAFATTVTNAEAELLAKNPEVQAVVDDAPIRLRHAGHQREEAGPRGRPSPPPEVTKMTNPSNAICDTLEPEALQLTQTAFLDPTTPQAQSLVDGTGVKVAYIADGLDINNPDFIRADGSHVFFDYQNFSGDASSSPTGGAEAFGDASSIAAQGRQVYDISQFVNPAHPLPSPCNIHIRGVAPGASLLGLNVFSNFGLTTTSNIVQAIEYAVVNDDVDVINESFGGNPYYDSGTDPIAMANTVAVNAGVTIVVSSGDAGTAGTIGSPATDPLFISVGASTQFRLYKQTASGAQPLATGYHSNNISSLSSGGFAQKSPRTVDLVAPGDLGWALCSADTSTYEECTSFQFVGSPIQDFGGTSESSPLTAGAAALVIQAYRSTHGGQSPTPALVKRILMSTAADLGAPAFEQGAGLLNTYAAVNAALSFHDQYGNPAKHGNSLIFSSTSSQIISSGGKHESESFTITNTGTTTRHLAPVLQTLGTPTGGATLTVNLTPASDPTFTFENGAIRAYKEQTFTVAAGSEHLDAAIAYQIPNPTQSQYYVWLALIDPSGIQAAFSLPQGQGNGYGHVDVVKPAAGQWKAVIFTRVPSAGASSYTGPVKFSWSTEKFVKFGTVSPASFDLAPGASKTVSTSFNMPSNPGDVAAALRFTPVSATIHDAEIPITLRTLVPMNSHGGSFTGTLTGGNGRGSTGPVQTFEFDVPSGVKDLNLALTLADPNYLLEGFLVDPSGMQLSVQPNVDNSGYIRGAMELSHQYPQAGRWHFVLLLDFVSSGNQTSIPYAAHITLNTAQYSAPGLPNSSATKLSASAGPVTIPITITNAGPMPEDYFADARLYTHVNAGLPVYRCSSSPNLPAPCFNTYLPTQVDHVEFGAKSTVPITMDAANEVGFYFGTGSPDLYSFNTGTDTVVASLATSEVPWAYWYIFPSEIGPYGSGGAPSAPVQTSATVSMRPFDPAMSADTGDAIMDNTFGGSTYNPLSLAPGASGVIHVTITPNASQVGQTIKGFVYIDTFNQSVGTGDEVIRIPYEYTVKH